MAKDNTISASHILIMHTESRNSESKLSKEEALKFANKLHVKLKKDLSAFKDLAINHSSCSSAQYGGSLGEFGKARRGGDGAERGVASGCGRGAADADGES